MLQLKQSLVSLHDIHSPQSGPRGGAATNSPLDAVMTTSAALQTQELVEQLKQEETQLQQRMVEIDAQLQYAEQVRCRAWWGSMLSHNVRNRCHACTDLTMYDTELLHILLPSQIAPVWLGGLALMMVHKCLLCCHVCWQVSVLHTRLHSTSKQHGPTHRALSSLEHWSRWQATHCQSFHVC